jgi:hypothetical protein
VVVDLGGDVNKSYTPTLKNPDVQDKNNQADCAAACAQRANGIWQADPAKVCAAYAQAKVSTLNAYAAVGTNKYEQAGSSIPAPPTSSLAFNPKFYILSISYALPGCTSSAAYNCSTKSSAVYSNGSSASTTTTIQQSVANGSTTTFDGSITAPITTTVPPVEFTATESASAGLKVTNANGSSATVSTGQSIVLSSFGGTQDGIDHNFDQFVIMLNPAVAVGKDCINGLRWNIGYASPPKQLLWDRVSTCQILGTCGPAMPVNVTNSHLTPSDWCAILSQDPFVPHCKSTPAAWPPPASDLTVPDLTTDPTTLYPGRYQYTMDSLPYGPPGSNGACDTSGTVITNSYQGGVTASSQTETSYSSTIGVSIGIPKVESVGLKDAKTVTFTNSVSTASMSGNNQGATANVACAGSNWNNSYSNVAVLYDTIYNSFLFTPITITGMRVIHQGRALDSMGIAGVPNQIVVLSIPNPQGKDSTQVYTTMTDRMGNYKIYSKSQQANSIPATVWVGGVPSKRGFYGTTGGIATAVKLGLTPVMVKMPGVAAPRDSGGGTKGSEPAKVGGATGVKLGDPILTNQQAVAKRDTNANGETAKPAVTAAVKLPAAKLPRGTNAVAETEKPAVPSKTCQGLSFSVKSRSGGPIAVVALSVVNHGPGNAGNVKLTSLGCSADFNSNLTLPYVVPGAAALAPNAPLVFNVTFRRPPTGIQPPTSTFSCTLSWAESSGCTGTQTINIP